MWISSPEKGYPQQNNGVYWLKATRFFLLAAVLLLLTSGTNLKVGWLVPSGQVEIDRGSLESPAGMFCALTFDDGPDALYTGQVQQILDEHRIKGTFFVIGSKIEKHPGVLRRLIAAGHEIGNHSYSHPKMTNLSRDSQISQIEKTQKLITDNGATAKWFRPPFGEFNRTTVKCASQHGLETILWTADPRDWSEPGVNTIHSRVINLSGPGAVILLHSTHLQTVSALPRIIESLRDKGYRFVTMSEWRILAGGNKLPEPVEPSGPDLPNGINPMDQHPGRFFSPFMPGLVNSSDYSWLGSIAPQITPIEPPTMAESGQQPPSTHQVDLGAQAEPEEMTVYANFSSVSDIERMFKRKKSSAGFACVSTQDGAL